MAKINNQYLFPELKTMNEKYILQFLTVNIWLSGTATQLFTTHSHTKTIKSTMKTHGWGIPCEAFHHTDRSWQFRFVGFLKTFQSTPLLWCVQGLHVKWVASHEKKDVTLNGRSVLVCLTLGGSGDFEPTRGQRVMKTQHIEELFVLQCAKVHIVGF